MTQLLTVVLSTASHLVRVPPPCARKSCVTLPQRGRPSADATSRGIARRSAIVLCYLYLNGRNDSDGTSKQTMQKIIFSDPTRNYLYEREPANERPGELNQ